MCLSSLLECDTFRSECCEMHFNARGVTVDPFAQVNFYDQVIVDP